MPFPKAQVGSMATGPVPTGPSISPMFGRVPVAPRAMEKEGAAQNCHINFNPGLWGYLFEHLHVFLTQQQASCSDNSQEIRNVP